MKDKPHIRKVFGRWWCFNSRKESDKSCRAWQGISPSAAYDSWHGFNRMKR